MLESWLDMFGKGFPPSPHMLVSLVLQQRERKQRLSPGHFFADPEPVEPPLKIRRRETEIRHTIGKCFFSIGDSSPEVPAADPERSAVGGGAA